MAKMLGNIAIKKMCTCWDCYGPGGDKSTRHQKSKERREWPKHEEYDWVFINGTISVDPSDFEDWDTDTIDEPIQILTNTEHTITWQTTTNDESGQQSK